MIVREREGGNKICTSVGVLLHTGELNPGGEPSFLLLEQLDVDGHPWGIPAGRTEPYETDPYQTAEREVLEETGLKIDTDHLNDYCVLHEYGGNTVKIVYSYQTSISSILPLSEWNYVNGDFVTKNQKWSDEIGRMAFISRFNMYHRGHPFIKLYYRWDVMHYVKAGLEGRRII